MASTLNSPQDYCDYFQHLVLYDTPPEQPKWVSGLKASQLWRDYCEKGGGIENQGKLVLIIKTLMPFRQRGTGLLALLQWILGHVAKLPVVEQKVIWLEVFNVDNQGENTIAHNEVAVEILQEWVELDSNIESVPINNELMMRMANRIYMYAFSGHDWVSFTAAISRWFEKYIDEPSFFDSVINELRKKPNSLEAA